MATKPVAWQEQGPVNLLDEGVSESWAQGGVDAIISHYCPPQDKRAPRAEPEEDIDVLESEARDETLQENQALSRPEIADATKLNNQESTRIFSCSHKETREMVTKLQRAAKLSETIQTEEESKMSIELCDDAFSPPPPPLSARSTEDCFEREGLSSLEGEVAEWAGDAEILSDPGEELMCPGSQKGREWPQTPLPTEPVHRGVDSTEDDMATEENFTQLNFLPDSFHNCEDENNILGVAAAGINSTAHHSPPGRNNSDDVYTMCSPPFADESEEEEEVSIDIMSHQQQWATLHITNKPIQPSYSANISVPTEQDTTSTLPAIPTAKQQEELPSQSQCELAPRGVNQEPAAQQVLGQGSPPLSPVAMELPNQDGAASQGPGCVVPLRERCSRAGERTDGESRQTGREEEQKEGELERNKKVGQQHGGGLLKSSQTVQTQELKAKYRFVSSKHSRMETDLCDDSQSDSGVSADFSPCSTLESNTTISTGAQPAAPKETPIEREIRRAVEREHSLRRSRGLPNPPTVPEYVEIPLRKTVLRQSLTVKAERCQGKDRKFAGKKMQHEIHEEAQREQDLVKLGKVPGFYDKGTVRQLKERKQLFEAFQKPTDSALTVSTRSKATSWSSASDISTLDNQGDISSQASTIGGSDVEKGPTQSPNSAKGRAPTSSPPQGPGLSEGTGCQVIILENNLSVPAQGLYFAKPEAEPVTAVNHGRPNVSSSRTGGHGGIKGRGQEKEEEEEEEGTKENPFYKLRSSTNLVKVERDIREAQEREKELHKQRISLYGGKEGAKGGGIVGGVGGGGGGRSGSREGNSSRLASSSLNGLAVPDSPGSSSRGVTGPPAGRQSVGKLGMWPPAQAEEEKINQPGVPHSPRSPRKKTPLVQRWESGLLNGHNEDGD